MLIEPIARGAQVFQRSTQGLAHHALGLRTHPGGVHLLEIVIAEFDHAAWVRGTVERNQGAGQSVPHSAACSRAGRQGV